MSELIRPCDNKSVGVIIKQQGSGDILLIRRAKQPYGWSTPGGHVDDHGTEKDAAIAEVSEETGIELQPSGLYVVKRKRVDLPCRRPGGSYHEVTIFEAEVPANVELNLDPDEAEDFGWYGRVALQGLADRARQLDDGLMSPEAYQQDPGLDPTTLKFFVELKYVR